jgi:hypothetical protein
MSCWQKQERRRAEGGDEGLKPFEEFLSLHHRVIGPGALDLRHIIALGPEHSQTITSGGWTKEQLKEAIWKQARIPVSSWPKGCPTKILSEKLGPLTPESLIPMTLKPEYFHVVIAGGAGKHSHMFAPFPGCMPVSKPVTK